MGAGKMYRGSKNYGGLHTGKGKKGMSKKREIRSVYAAGSHSVLKHNPGYCMSKREGRVRRSNVMNPITYGVRG